MGFRIKELEAKRKRKLALIEEEMIEKVAMRYGGASKDPDKTQEAFIYKIKAIRHQLQDEAQASLATDNLIKELKDKSHLHHLPISKVEPSLLLDLL